MGWLRSSYFGRHWRGELSLGVSYWGNGFLGTIAIVALAGAVSRLMGDDYHPIRNLAFFLSLLFVALAFSAWQLVGIWRSAGRYRRGGGRLVWFVLARLLVVLGVLRVGWDMATQSVPQLVEAVRIAAGDPDVGGFDIRLLADGTEMEFRGGIPFGATEVLRQRLDAAPQVRVLHLNSHGGRIVEAERMRELIRERRLLTYTASGCISACTVAFLGGVERYVHPQARLGFHGGSFPGVPPAELKRQTDRIVNGIVAFGVKRPFVEKAYAVAHADVWYPELTELIEARYIIGPSARQFALSGAGPQPDVDELRRDLRQSAVFDALAGSDPARLEAAVTLLAEGMREGRNEGAVAGLLQELVAAATRELTPRASDEAILERARVLVDQLAALGQKNPDACRRFLFPEPGRFFDIGVYVDQDLMARDLASTAHLLASAGPGPSDSPGAEEAGRLIGLLRHALAGHHGDAALQSLARFGSPEQTAEEACAITHLLYAEAIALPAPEGPRLLRYLLSN